MLLPHGWQSQTPAFSHLQRDCCTASEPNGNSGSRRGIAKAAIGALMQVLHSLRCLSRSATGAGGLIEQFWATAVSVMRQACSKRQALLTQVRDLLGRSPRHIFYIHLPCLERRFPTCRCSCGRLPCNANCWRGRGSEAAPRGSEGLVHWCSAMST